MDNRKDSRSRQERARYVTTHLPAAHKAKFEKLQSDFRLALAMVYGNRLDPLIVDDLTNCLILDADINAALCGVHSGTPTDAAGWQERARTAVRNDELASLNLNHSDAMLKRELAEKYIESLSPAQQMTMDRNGTLQASVDEHIRRKIEDLSWRGGT